MNNKSLLSFVLLLGLLFCFFSACNQENNSEPGANKPANENAAPPTLTTTPVQASPAFIGTLVQRITATGLAQARRQVTVRSKISGIISKIQVQEGQYVRQGALLLQLQDKELLLALDEARSNYMQASIEFGKLVGERKSSVGATGAAREGGLLSVKAAEKRMRRLNQPGKHGQSAKDELLWAQAELDAAKLFASPNKEPLIAFQSGLTAANFKLRRAESDVANSRITADFDGYVGGIKVHEGDLVSSGQECMQLLDLSRIIIHVGVLETEVNALAVGRKALVTFAALPKKALTGKVISISPIVDKEEKTCKVQVKVDNRAHLLKAGMFASCRIDAHIYKNLLLVPKAAILERDKRKLVFIVRDNKAKWCYVETGRENHDYVEILSSAFDLKPGEPVITSGQYTLVHDAPVRVVTKKGTTSPNNKESNSE